MNIQAAREQFIQNGYDPIPLKPKAKEPFAINWQGQLTFTQWHKAPGNANIGLRAGSGRAFIDCDNNKNPETFQNVTRWLDTLGYRDGSYPVIATPSGVGRHIYVNLSGALLGNWQVMNSAIGTGEFRYGAGAYVGTFPSMTEGGGYSLISGDIAHLPALDLHDIRTLIDPDKATETPRKVIMSAGQRAMANGQGIERYKHDRSAAECGLVLSLINSGFAYMDIKRVFDKYPCFGHYAEHKAQSQQEGERWLYRTYRAALEYSNQESDTRKILAQLQDLARVAAWKHASDRNIFISLAGIGFKAGRFTVAAGLRDLALSAGVSLRTASAGTSRLIGQGIITKEAEAKAVFAAVYAIQPDKALLTLTAGMDKPEHFLQTPCEEVFTFVPDMETIAQHDAFRNGKNRLGRRAGQIYQLLTRAPMTEQQLADATGAHIKTIRRALSDYGNNKPSLVHVTDHKTGEVIQMVTCKDGLWKAARVDLDLISAIMGTYGATGKQRLQYERERREHTRGLELGKLRETQRPAVTAAKPYQRLQVEKR
jgi:hypothetical protein